MLPWPPGQSCKKIIDLDLKDRRSHNRSWSFVRSRSLLVIFANWSWSLIFDLQIRRSIFHHKFWWKHTYLWLHMSRNVALEGRYIENSIEYIIFEATVLLYFICNRHLQNLFAYFVIFTHFLAEKWSWSWSWNWSRSLPVI